MASPITAPSCARSGRSLIALKRTGRVSDPGGLNHRAAGCPAAQDDQTQYVHPFARLCISPVRLNTSTAGQAGREARGADRRRGSVQPSEASPTAEKRERDGRSLGTEAIRVLSGTAQRRVKSGCQFKGLSHLIRSLKSAIFVSIISSELGA